MPHACAAPLRLSRRASLRVGGLALGGLALPQVLRATGQAASAAEHKSVIMVFLPGGPSHLDMFDLKPDAPAEIRGPFRPIASAVPGFDVCEHLPRLAALADRYTVVRSLVGGVDDHSSHYCLTGHSGQGPKPSGGWPALGSVASRLLGASDVAVPPTVDLAWDMEHKPYNNPGPGFLGAAHSAFHYRGEGRADLELAGLEVRRLDDRRALLADFDRLRHSLDSSGAMHGLDAFTARAFGILTSPRLVEALDLGREDPQVRAAYGRGDDFVEPTLKASPRLIEPLLAARRLVEVGVRCVTVSFGAWDWHDKNFVALRSDLPLYDQALSALIADITQRGLDRDVLVVAWGEFGRSPRINGLAGRDHWPAVSNVLLAGGGLRSGQPLGSSNRWGEAAQDRPVHFQEVFATIYRHLGIDAENVTLPDLAGRPQYVLDGYRPIAELF
jgi:hypothetical protein